jgi:hypothetical protein
VVNVLAVGFCCPKILYIVGIDLFILPLIKMDLLMW